LFEQAELRFYDGCVLGGDVDQASENISAPLSFAIMMSER
jgi:hypothetical protein